MYKVFKYRLYPSKSQAAKLEWTLRRCEEVYNRLLEEKERVWKDDGRSTTLFDMTGLLVKWKRGDPTLKQVHSSVLNDVCLRLDRAYKNFFRRLGRRSSIGFPSKKRRGDCRSITYRQTGLRVSDNRETVYISKIGDIKIRYHRDVIGDVKTVTVHKDRYGLWWVSAVCKSEPSPGDCLDTVVGIDLGITHLATLSTGERIENKMFFRRCQSEWERAKYLVSRQVPGTKEYDRRMKILLNIERRIQNRRENYLRHISRMLVDRFQIIVFEKINTRSIMRSASTEMRRDLHDAAWYKLVEYTQRKAKELGRSVILVDPTNTSKMCSKCGFIAENMNSAYRTYDCPECDLSLDRDHNAALNILALGLQCVGEQSLEGHDRQ